MKVRSNYNHWKLSTYHFLAAFNLTPVIDLTNDCELLSVKNSRSQWNINDIQNEVNNERLACLTYLRVGTFYIIFTAIKFGMVVSASDIISRILVQ